MVHPKTRLLPANSANLPPGTWPWQQSSKSYKGKEIHSQRIFTMEPDHSNNHPKVIREKISRNFYLEPDHSNNHPKVIRGKRVIVWIFPLELDKPARFRFSICQSQPKIITNTETAMLSNCESQRFVFVRAFINLLLRPWRFQLCSLK